ncbi:SMI1/KNR4 family protein [Vibrio profundum]|uniref:SMI1/KNR4 family protein n=1 Tax=Vibrio profundum TaxID=2910247 RepID=UPI003D0CBF45
MFGKAFIDPSGNQYGSLRKVEPTIPRELFGVDVIAEDECGNYFILAERSVYFWDHETSDRILLTPSLFEFEKGCVEPRDIELSEEQVVSVWIDPEFAKLHGLKPKP